jgi:hypothetical protein
VSNYTYHGPFAYSLRCPECRREVEHTEAVHNVYAFGITTRPRIST